MTIKTFDTLLPGDTLDDGKTRVFGTVFTETLVEVFARRADGTVGLVAAGAPAMRIAVTA